MLIRSQGKMGIINLDCVEAVGIVDEYIIRAYAGNTVYGLGEYSTEEKALKVLDMIQKKYLEYENFGGKVLNQYSAVSPFSFVPPKVFQMPQDSEV